MPSNPENNTEDTATSSARMYSCATCGKRYQRNTHLRRHEATRKSCTTLPDLASKLVYRKGLVLVPARGAAVPSVLSTSKHVGVSPSSLLYSAPYAGVFLLYPFYFSHDSICGASVPALRSSHVF